MIVAWRTAAQDRRGAGERPAYGRIKGASCAPVGLNEKDSTLSIIAVVPALRLTIARRLRIGFLSFRSFASSSSDMPTRDAAHFESSENAGCSPNATTMGVPPAVGWKRTSFCRFERLIP